MSHSDAVFRPTVGDRPAQTSAFEIDGDLIRALYVVRNPDKLKHLQR